jgi:hypothetical protein
MEEVDRTATVIRIRTVVMIVSCPPRKPKTMPPLARGPKRWR